MKFGGLIGIFLNSAKSKYGYLEVFQRVPSTSRYRESTVLAMSTKNLTDGYKIIYLGSMSQLFLKLMESLNCKV